MSAESSITTWRGVVGASAVGAIGLTLLAATAVSAAEDNAIRPFRVEVSEEALLNPKSARRSDRCGSARLRRLSCT
jgi:hypothetical protein